MEELTAEEYQATLKTGKSKFGSIKTRCNHNHLHDSKKEATRCSELHVLQRGGVISRLKSQVKFTLQNRFRYDHEIVRPICYIADFTYYEDGVFVVEDVKGRLTDVYKIKKKMLLHKLKNRKKWKFLET